MKNIIQEIKDCCSVRINCGKCGSREKVYFIPESIISKLEVAVAKMETTTSTCKDSLQVGDMAAMRGALEHVEKLAREFAAGNYYVSDFPKMLLDAIRPALSAPPRNCDLYTNYGDAIRAFEDDEDAESFEDIGEWLFCETEGGAE